MQVYEIQPLLDKAWMKSREGWEQTRTICGYLHRAWFKGEPKMKFPWDGQDSEQKVTKEQAAELTRRMQREEKRMRKKAPPQPSPKGEGD